MKITMALLAAFLTAATVAFPTVALADSEPPPCSSGQVVVTASNTEGAATHRGVVLTFSLAAGASPCTLTGYPGVDSGAGGPLIHAQRTLRGYMGGLPTAADGISTVL